MACRMLVTHALPDANGILHLGHMVESVQTDVFVRAMNALGKECVFICADDAHGTAIEISARKAGVAPEEWIEKIHRSEEHTSELQSRGHLVCRLLLEKKKKHDQHIEQNRHNI